MKPEQKLLKLAREQPPTYMGFYRGLLYSALALIVANSSTSASKKPTFAKGKRSLICIKEENQK